VYSLVTGLAQELAVRELIGTPGAQGFLVVKLLGGESAMSVVGTPTGGALTSTASSLPGQTLN
jgi:hypothetical protein